MSSDENLRKLGNCITALEEQADKLRKRYYETGQGLNQTIYR